MFILSVHTNADRTLHTQTESHMSAEEANYYNNGVRTLLASVDW